MRDQSPVMMGAVLGALVGAAAGYLFFTDGGRGLRERIEPTVDDLRREFGRFQKTIEKMGELANDGMRVMEEFRTARGHYPPTSH